MDSKGFTVVEAAPVGQQQPVVSSMRANLLYAMVCLQVLAESLDATSIAVVLPTIAEVTNASSTASFMLGTSFLLASTVFQPLFSELSHSTGRKPMYLLALALLMAGSVVAAVSSTIALMLVGRVIQGIGAAGAMALSTVVMADLFPLRKRAKYTAGLNAMWTLGSVTGPIVGGAFTEHLSWRWIFWINLPFVGIPFISFIFLLGFDKPQGAFWENLVSADLIGLSIFIPSSVALLLPITLGGLVYSWSSWQTIIPLGLGAGGLAVFAYHQRILAKRPTFPAAMFPTLTAALSQLGFLVQGALLWILLYYICLYFQGVRMSDPVMTGVYALPGTLTVAPTVIVVSIAIAKTGHYRWSIWLGWILTTLNLGLLCLLRIDTPIAQIVVITLALGLGIGNLIAALPLAAQASLSRKLQGHASAFSILLRSAGQCLGIAIGTAVFSNVLKKQLPGFETAGGGSITAESLLHQLTAFETDSTEEAIIRKAIADALVPLWMTSCGISALMGLFNLTMKCPPLPEDGEEPDQKEASSSKL